ncbi:cytochrome c biogenesis CcdA family protein [Saliphagus infecundisoli]|uniref:Cytochrome c biogenesis CcdA family protein n=1 Tax=Saliphagus infecundisoli TaxID=1849069 RepID=A0ABD5QCN5_9EURY|nr:cytochrome c biogenesis protein CcdA [Saliphagus infecundisoli]
MSVLDPGLATTLAFAFTAGIATFFSPCAYPLLPGYVGFYASQTGEEATVGGAVGRGLIAGAGVLATLVVLIGVAFAVGNEAFSRVTLFEPVVGGLLVVLGALVVAGRAPSLSLSLPKRRSSVVGFGIFGVGYALAAVGCVAPVFLMVVARALSLPTASTALVFGTYIAGIVLLMVAVTVATGTGLMAGAGRLAHHGRTLERLAGGLMIVAGAGQLYLSIVVLDAV